MQKLNVLTTTASAFALSCPRLPDQKEPSRQTMGPSLSHFTDEQSKTQREGKICSQTHNQQGRMETKWFQAKPNTSPSSFWLLQGPKAYYYFRLINIPPLLSFGSLRMEEIFSPRCWSIPGSIVSLREEEKQNKTQRKLETTPFRSLHILAQGEHIPEAVAESCTGIIA